MTRLAALLVIFVGATGGCLGTGPTTDGPQAGPPGFSVTTIDNETWSLAAKMGTTVVLDFMEPYCGACRLQMPALLEAYAALDDVTFLSVDISATTYGPGSWDRDALVHYRDRYAAPWDFAPDADGSLLVRFQVDATPTLIVLDATATTLGRHVGNGLDGPGLAAWVEQVRSPAD